MTASSNGMASVLMVSYQYAPALDGGAERQAQRLAEGLVARGRRVGVVTARHTGLPPFERLQGVEVHRIWAIARPGRLTATFVPSLIRFLTVHGRGYTIWHAHQAFYNAWVSLRLGRLFGRRCIVKAAASGPYGDLARLGRVPLGRLVRTALRSADALVSLNAELTTELLSAGVGADRICMIPNGVDCSDFSPPSATERKAARTHFGIPADAVVAAFAGRLAENKGVLHLVDAWRLLEEQSGTGQWILLIAGAGEQADVCERRARGLKRLRFLGRLEDVRPLLRAADLLVHPSLAEGTSNIVLEAMATGIPVLATSIGGLTEQVQHDVNGLLVAPRDATALATGLAALLTNPDRRAAMGPAARRTVEQRYSLASMIDQYERLYAQLTRLDLDS